MVVVGGRGSSPCRRDAVRRRRGSTGDRRFRGDATGDVAGLGGGGRRDCRRRGRRPMVLARGRARGLCGSCERVFSDDALLHELSRVLEAFGSRFGDLSVDGDVSLRRAVTAPGCDDISYTGCRIFRRHRSAGVISGRVDGAKGLWTLARSRGFHPARGFGLWPVLVVFTRRC